MPLDNDFFIQVKLVQDDEYRRNEVNRDSLSIFHLKKNIYLEKRIYQLMICMLVVYMIVKRYN